MSFDLVPGSFWKFPSFRIPSIWDDEEEDKWLSLPNTPSGLTVSEDKSNVYVEAAVPGINPDEVEITYDKGMLWIRAQGQEEEKEKKYYRKATSSFSYQVAIPGNIDEKSEPEAVCKNGMMKVTFKKVPETKPKKITIKKA